MCAEEVSELFADFESCEFLLGEFLLGEFLLGELLLGELLLGESFVPFSGLGSVADFASVEPSGPLSSLRLSAELPLPLRA